MNCGGGEGDLEDPITWLNDREINDPDNNTNATAIPARIGTQFFFIYL